jgi:hypothetical protein
MNKVSIPKEQKEGWLKRKARGETKKLILLYLQKPRTEKELWNYYQRLGFTNKKGFNKIKNDLGLIPAEEVVELYTYYLEPWRKHTREFKERFSKQTSKKGSLIERLKSGKFQTRFDIATLKYPDMILRWSKETLKEYWNLFSYVKPDYLMENPHPRYTQIITEVSGSNLKEIAEKYPDFFGKENIKNINSDTKKIKILTSFLDKRFWSNYILEHKPDLIEKKCRVVRL